MLFYLCFVPVLDVVVARVVTLTLAWAGRLSALSIGLW